MKQFRTYCYIDASREYISGKNQNTLSEDHIHRIMETFNQREASEKYSSIATLEEFAENDYNLNIPRYVDTFEEEEEIDIDAVQQEIDELEKELVEIRAKMAEKMREIER